jgi:hypothetical protein
VVIVMFAKQRLAASGLLGVLTYCCGVSEIVMAHEEGIILGVSTEGQLIARFAGEQPLPLAPVDGALQGCARAAPGVADVSVENAAVDFGPLSGEAIIILQIVSIDGAMSLWTSGLDTRLDQAGESWIVGSPPFDEHPAWHIDSLHPRFDAEQSFSAQVRFVDGGTSAHAPSEVLELSFTCARIGACCVGLTCGHLIEADCSADGGAYIGDDTICLESADGDTVDERCDNCADAANEDQTDRDGDGVGDSCDECPDHANRQPTPRCPCDRDPSDCRAPMPVPCAPTWGMIQFSLALLTAGKVVFGRPVGRHGFQQWRAG